LTDERTKGAQTTVAFKRLLLKPNETKAIIYSESNTTKRSLHRQLLKGIFVETPKYLAASDLHLHHIFSFNGEKWVTHTQ